MHTIIRPWRFELDKCTGLTLASDKLVRFQQPGCDNLVKFEQPCHKIVTRL